MNVAALLAPLAQLAPSPLVGGFSSVVDGLNLRDVDDLVPRISGALEGAAGDAIASTLGEGTAGVHEAFAAGEDIDRIARRAEAAVQAAIGDITLIAQECLQEVVAAIITTAVSAGPLAALTGPKVGLIVQQHMFEAQQRLMDLGQELTGLTSEITGVHVPAPPGSPTGNEAPTEVASAAPQAEATEQLIKDAEGSNAPVGSGATSGVHPDIAGSSTDNGDAILGAPTPQAAAAVEAARTAMGTPYQWGGTVPGEGLDCSGLTQWAYAQAGVDIPRTAQEQAVGSSVPADQLAPGDLAVWDGHVAMITGDGQMIEAGDPVQVSPVRTENIGMNFLGFYRPTG